MPQQAATVKSLNEAYSLIKEMKDQDYEWGEDYRHYGRIALKAVIEGQMQNSIDQYLSVNGGKEPSQ